MLEILNRYSHGLASIPLIHALRERGCLVRLEEAASVSTEELACEFSANRGYLEAALRMLVCLDWIRPAAGNRYEAAPGLANASVIPTQIMELYRFPFDSYVQGSAGESLDPWLARSERRWDSEHPYLPDYLDGLIVIPLLLALRAQGRMEISGEHAGTGTTVLHLRVEPALRDAIERLFVARLWAAKSGDTLRLNRAGSFIVERIAITAAVASYKPMLGQAQELLFGNAAEIFTLDAVGHETHVDRTLNVTGSGFQHEKYFAALSECIVRLFDHDDFASQPKYIADMGCGDGSLLRRLYDTVRDKTKRGKVLGAHPLIPIAADFNEKALIEASRTLNNIKHIVLRGDIGNPEALLEALCRHGIQDLHRVLHVRSFMDHNRPYLTPQDCEVAGRRPHVPCSGMYIDPQGQAIPPADMLQSTVEHLRRWGQVVNEHGLVMLEVHCLPLAMTARYLDESESFHFDLYHALSHQYLLDAQTFLACAAEAGLFCRDGQSLTFPKNLPFTRISLSHFERRPYIVRWGLHEDRPALAQLEEVWAQPQSSNTDDTSVSEFVLEAENRVMVSVRCSKENKVRLLSMCAASDAPEDYLWELLQFVEQYWIVSGLGRVANMNNCQAILSMRKGETSVARAVACEMRNRVAGYPFKAEDDPRAAEHELGIFAFRWLLAHLQRLGVMRAAGEAHSIEMLKRRLGVVPKYHPYFDALMRRLQDEGLVVVRRGQVTTTPLVSNYALTSVEEQVDEFKRLFQQRYPHSVGLMNLTACCLSCYAEILTGRVDIAEVLFQNTNANIFSDVFRGDVVSDFFNRIVADTVEAVLEPRKTNAAKIRILEVGAGTGGTTTAVLEALQPYSGSVAFCFSDISLSFIRSARRRLDAQYPWIEYRTLNIEENLAQQGFEMHGFDIIVAANVLHDTRDIELTLKQTHSLLKPGGLLILNEYTSVKDCLTFSGALLHGWWLFRDPERRLRDSCLMSVPQWRSALEHSGFSFAEAFTLPTQNTAAECTQSVMLCEAGARQDSFTAATPNVMNRVSPAARREATPAPVASGGILEEFVEQDIRTILGGARAAAYQANRPLMEMGLDSIELVEFKSLLEQRFSVKLSPMFLFEDETPKKVAAALSGMISDQQHENLRREKPGAGPARFDWAVDDMAAETAAATEKLSGTIAIVGVACRFPGDASSPEAFWKLLERNGHGIISMPSGRWQWPRCVELEGKHKGIEKGGFLDRIDEFDASFFRISPREARLMDPQQRLLLELSWDVLEDAGHPPAELKGRKIGVFVGACHGDYRDLVIASGSDNVLEAYTGSGSAHSVLANRISYFYDLKGPSISIDTACSSSLFALHDAVNSIRHGECEQALVGAINLLSSPANSISYYQAGMLSPRGVCCTFDAAADGFVRGEGGAMLLLKPLTMALADGDSIYGLVRGTAVNHGGQAASLTAPKPEAQAAVIEAAWQAADVELESIGYIETHGTGTRLGDPVEVGGLTEAFRRLYQARGEAWPPKARCGLGSAKANVGHLEGAAGLAGLIKVLMAMQHSSLPALLNFKKLNCDIDLTETPFYIVRQNQTWPRHKDKRGRELPRRAGVSSFGFGGANAHAVIEECPIAVSDTESGNVDYLIPLSAKTDEQLLERAARLLEFLESDARGKNMASAAYTLQVGREHMQERAAFIVQNIEELQQALRACIAGNRTMPNCYWRHSKHVHSVAMTSPSEIERSIASRDLAKLASLWAQGCEVDWSKLYGKAKPGRMHLPVYPFTRERYWLEAAQSSQATVSVLHPLLHSNTSDLTEQRYSSTFTGEEFFLADHRIQGMRLLPAVAYLEMVREAITRAVRGPESLNVCIKNFTWLQPLVASEEPVRVHICLFPEGKNEISFEIYSSFGPAARTVHARGAVVTGAWVEAPRLDTGAIAKRYQQGTYSAQTCYAAFARLGIEYGNRHRGIQGLHVEADEVIARLSLPALRTENQFVLHPGMTDSALQAVIGFSLASSMTNSDKTPFLVSELRNAEIYGPCCSQMWAVVRRTSISDGGTESFDIDMCDDAGVLCIRLRSLSTQRVKGRRERFLPFAVEKPRMAPTGHSECLLEPALATGLSQQTKERLFEEHGRVSARSQKGEPQRVASVETPVSGEMILTPVWESVTPERNALRSSLTSGCRAILGGTSSQWLAIQGLYPEAKLAHLNPQDIIDGICEKIRLLGKIGQIVWIVPQSVPAALAAESVIGGQHDGVLLGFRLIKAMLALGYGDEALTWTVLTTGVEAIDAKEQANPTHASVHGLMGSAANEYANWTVQLIDLQPSGDWPWEEILATPAPRNGSVLAYREGRWYEQQLMPQHLSGNAPVMGISDEVYVIVGGHGGIGSAWSEILLRRSPVQLVWIGRREMDSILQSRIDRLAEFGPAPLYISADITDRQQLERARVLILRKFGRIDGLIHAAMVLQDHSLANMTEDAFRVALQPKVDGSVRLAQVFGQDTLRFVLFFSSCNSFMKLAGQSNYVAGCTFMDSFARRMSREWPCRVRIVNWGYWGTVGAAASERYGSIMARKGLGSIEVTRAAQILDELLNGELVQMVYLETIQPNALQNFQVHLQHVEAKMDLQPQAVVPKHAETGRPATVDEIMSSSRNVAIGHLLATVRLRVAETLGLDPVKLDLLSRPFTDMLLGELGMDSLSSNDLRNTLRKELEVDVPVQRIIGDKVHSWVDALYDELLIRRVSNIGAESCEDRETYVF